MKTVLIRGREAPPRELVDIVRQGSTSLDEISTRDLATFTSRESFGADRLVFWSGHEDADVRTLALNYTAVEDDLRAQRIVFVTAQPTEAPLDGMTREEVLVWPRDEEKIRMLFMTAG